MQSGGSQLESLQVLLREARQHAAGLQGEQQQLEHMQRRLKQALIKVTPPCVCLSVLLSVLLSVCLPSSSVHVCINVGVGVCLCMYVCVCVCVCVCCVSLVDRLFAVKGQITYTLQLCNIACMVCWL